jgi:16S rRNA (guanine527-N7)-methyltransferase
MNQWKKQSKEDFSGKGRAKPPVRRQGKRLTPGVKSLGILLERHGVSLKKETLEQLWAFHQLLRENNHDQDLTRLNAFETMVERHYADCILPGAFVEKWPSRMIDVGSGAGFPGFPLKIVHPRIHLTLCEPRPRRVDFLNYVIEELGLKNIDVFGHKVTSRSMTLPVEGMISRAFEKIEKTLPRLENSLLPGGRAYFMKGPAVAEELKEFQSDEYSLVGEHWYDIPNSTQKRALIVLERKKESLE